MSERVSIFPACRWRTITTGNAVEANAPVRSPAKAALLSDFRARRDRARHLDNMIDLDLAITEHKRELALMADDDPRRPDWHRRFREAERQRAAMDGHV
jgi:hypothetical protein